jgi:hypothetical protein
MGLVRASIRMIQLNPRLSLAYLLALSFPFLLLFWKHQIETERNRVEADFRRMGMTTWIGHPAKNPDYLAALLLYQQAGNLLSLEDYSNLQNAKTRQLNSLYQALEENFDKPLELIQKARQGKTQTTENAVLTDENVQFDLIATALAVSARHHWEKGNLDVALDRIESIIELDQAMSGPYLDYPQIVHPIMRLYDGAYTSMSSRYVYNPLGTLYSKRPDEFYPFRSLACQGLNKLTPSLSTENLDKVRAPLKRLIGELLDEGVLRELACKTNYILCKIFNGKGNLMGIEEFWVAAAFGR